MTHSGAGVAGFWKFLIVVVVVVVVGSLMSPSMTFGAKTRGISIRVTARPTYILSYYCHQVCTN